ncbi:TIGR03086 family metal-binding protein [Nonomuraea sp. B19D2]|uniref:TIGR03086 family metal-binding protein n=1 Tax=Nonomuraea sp. B19D2 TaxID=3159561 RepID=UPI0032DA9056
MTPTVRDTSQLLPEADLVALDAQAVLTSVEVVARATTADMSRPTPCADWSLDGLLAHMTAQHHGFAAASTGDDDPASWTARPLGHDLVGAYRSSAHRVLAAFADDGVMNRMFPLPEVSARPFSARRAIGFHLLDYVVHSWDVAKTLGLTVEFESDVLHAALIVAQAVPQGEARRAPGAAFAPAIAWSGGAALDRIVAVLGRSPNWPH